MWFVLFLVLASLFIWAFTLLHELLLLLSSTLILPQVSSFTTAKVIFYNTNLIMNSSRLKSFSGSRLSTVKPELMCMTCRVLCQGYFTQVLPYFLHSLSKLLFPWQLFFPPLRPLLHCFFSPECPSPSFPPRRSGTSLSRVGSHGYIFLSGKPSW